MISVIAAIAQNGAIGCHNKLIWHIAEDLRRFKAVTTGHPVVMGRRTFESIGRPLPGRTNVVLSRSPGYSAEGVVTAGSLEEAVKMFPSGEEIFIIGGGELYRQAMPLADRFYPTVVHADYAGDTYFPEWDPAQWRLAFEERHEKGEKFDKPFTFYRYERNYEL